jgi:hypothetical protein
MTCSLGLRKNNLCYRHCEARSNLIISCSKSKDCFNRTSFAMTYRFSIKKEQPLLPSLRGTKQSNLIVRYSISKDCFNRTSFAMTYRFSIKKEITSVTVFARHEAILLFGVLNQKFASIDSLSQ